MSIVNFKVLMPIILTGAVLIGITFGLKFLRRELGYVSETLADMVDVFLTEFWPKMAEIIGFVVTVSAIIHGIQIN